MLALQRPKHHSNLPGCGHYWKGVANGLLNYHQYVYALCIATDQLTDFLKQFQKFNTLPKLAAEQQDPLYRLFAREGNIGHKLLGTVRKDMEDVVKVCMGELKQTNHLRTLMSSLTKGDWMYQQLRVLVALTFPFQALSLLTGDDTKFTNRWPSLHGY